MRKSDNGFLVISKESVIGHLEWHIDHEERVLEELKSGNASLCLIALEASTKVSLLEQLRKYFENDTDKLCFDMYERCALDAPIKEGE
jgi:hypothetical protein